jgi:hypothetical protein
MSTMPWTSNSLSYSESRNILTKFDDITDKFVARSSGEDIAHVAAGKGNV